MCLFAIFPGMGVSVSASSCSLGSYFEHLPLCKPLEPSLQLGVNLNFRCFTSPFCVFMEQVPGPSLMMDVMGWLTR